MAKQQNITTGAKTQHSSLMASNWLKLVSADDETSQETSPDLNFGQSEKAAVIISRDAVLPPDTALSQGGVYL